jgi:riboflavin biosynthesis pyrimidine reductase
MWIPGGVRGVHPQSGFIAVDNSVPVVSETVRQLLPTPIDHVDPLDLYLADDRPAHPERPWLMCNMIASVDGATTLGGLSGDLGGPADKAVFRAVRASCDWILVASATAAAEGYQTPRSAPEVAKRRVAQGRSPAPRLAIVTASGKVDPTVPAFCARRDDDEAPLVIAGSRADAGLLGALDAEIVRLREDRPEPEAILHELRRRGATVVLAEGGPRFNGVLHDAGVIDELCLSLSPTLAGGSSARIVAHSADDMAVGLRLDRLLEEDDLLFARYLRA